MTDEFLEAMRELWTSATPSFAGKYTQFSDLVFEPKPVQKPHPPIWVGGHSRAALRRTARFGAAWHPINRLPEELRAGRAELARLCREGDRATPPALTLRNDIRVARPGESVPASTHGGRVLCVTALGDALRIARTRAYEAVDQIRFDGMQFRRDIGRGALKSEV